MPPSGRKRGMVAGDDQDTRDVLYELFALLGHEPIMVATGAEALTAFVERRPQIVFVDLGLPDMSGLEVVAQLRALSGEHRVTIIALTGWAQPRDRASSLAAGVDLHLAKPVGIHVLRGVVGDAVQGGAPEVEPTTGWAEGSNSWALQAFDDGARRGDSALSGGATVADAAPGGTRG